MSSRLSTTRSETFDLVSCRDVLEKLRREIKRIKDAKDRQDVCDHGTNAAFTAWHMTDWVWADMKKNRAIRPTIAKQADRDPGNFRLPAFQNYVTKNSKALRICRIIATASKHVGWDPGGTDLELTATGLTITEDSTVPLERWILKVKIDDQSYEALPIFTKAFRYWESFTEKHQIGAPEESRQ